jgi:glycerol uptake facilitator-like aquaporin
MGERLAGGNVALALLGNTLPTGAILVVLILALGPISGAHFNPAVSLVMSLRKDHPWREFFPYAGAQIAGGCIGTLVAHGMFELPLLELAIKRALAPRVFALHCNPTQFEDGASSDVSLEIAAAAGRVVPLRSEHGNHPP